MARILFGSMPAHGVINPSFPLAKALVEAGHEVDYLVPEAFRSAVERIGATALPWAFYLDGAITRPRDIQRFGRRLFTDLDAALRTLGPRYDAVVAAGLQPTLRSLQDDLDVPVIFCSPVFFQNARVAEHLAAICTGLPAPVRRLLASRGARTVMGNAFGLSMVGRPIGDVVDIMGPWSRTMNITPASRLYQPLAEDFTDPTCVFMGPTPTLAASEAVLADFPIERVREHDGPVIYGTLGTVFNTWTPFFRTIADAFAGTEALVVLTTGNETNRAAVGPVADNVILRSFVPQAEILERADVCFTHGGFGSVTDAVVQGAVPILTPMGADQFFNAYRVQELGAGRVLPKGDVTVDAVRSAAEAALHDAELVSGLGRLRASFAEAEGPEGVARRIGDLMV